MPEEPAKILPKLLQKPVGRPKEIIQPKEIIIKLNIRHLVLAGYILLILALVTIIVLQHYEVIPTRAQTNEEESEVVGTIEEKPLEVEVVEPEVVEEVIEEEEEEVIVEEETNTLLPITGEIHFTIDSLDPIHKDTWAKLVSVTFTIKNQDEDFTPTVKGYLLSDSNDDKEVDYSELEAGTYLTKKETKLFFSYNEPDEEQTLKLELYDEKNKLLKSITKKFTAAS